MGLEGQQQTPPGEGAACGRNRRRHLHRVMTIVVDQGEAAGLVAVEIEQVHLAIALEATPDTAKIGQRLDDRGIGHLHLGRHCNRGERVEHVVHARQVELDGQTRSRAIDPHAVEQHASAIGTHVLGANARTRAQSVAHDLLRYLRHYLAHVGVFIAQHGDTVERQALQEVDEGLLDTAKVVAVGIHVIGVDVGHHRDHRTEQQEGGIGLVRLGHQEVALAQPRVGAGGIEPTTDDEGRVHRALGEDAGHQRGGGGLAVGAGDGNALLEAHQLGQHLRARHDRDVTLTRGHHLGVVVLDRGGHHQHIRVVHIRCGVTTHHARAHLLQAGSGGIDAEVGAAHRITLIDSTSAMPLMPEPPMPTK